MSDSPSRRNRPSLAAWSRDPLTRFRQEMDDLVARVWGDGEEISPGHVPTAIDLSETDEELRIRIDLPGVKPDQIDIQLSGNLLTVTGAREEEVAEPGRSFHRIERTFGRFTRTISLPCEINEEAIEARCEHGVVTIRLPKAEKSRSRKIEVRGS